MPSLLPTSLLHSVPSVSRVLKVLSASRRIRAASSMVQPRLTRRTIWVFTSGNLAGQARRISDYDGTTEVITITPALTEAPVGGDTGLILGRIEAT